MTWSNEFKNALHLAAYRPTWLVKSLWSPSGAADSVLYASHSGLGGKTILAEPPKVTAASIRPGTWSPSYASWSFLLKGLAPELVTQYPRGSMLELQLWPQGLDQASMEPVALGVIRSVKCSPGRTEVQCWDLVTAMKNRLTTAPADLNIFNGVVRTATLAADYQVGDTTIDLVDASSLQQNQNGHGCIRLNDAGTPFYLTYTGISGNQLTGVFAPALPFTAVNFGTYAVGCASGEAVANVGYLEGHPFDIARRVLCSGGGGGQYDDLPQDWGLRLPDVVWDHDDVDAWKARVQPSAGPYHLEIPVEAPITTGAFTWLQSMLSMLGIWIVQRQGRLSIRAALDPSTLDWAEAVITEADLAEGSDAWSTVIIDEAMDVEFAGVTVKTLYTSMSGLSAYGGRVDTAPAGTTWTYDLSPIVWDNQTAILTEVLDRLRWWLQRPPERIFLRCRGWRLAGLVPGSPVTLNLPRLVGRLSAVGMTYENWPAIVAEVAPDFSRHEVRLVVWPSREEYA